MFTSELRAKKIEYWSVSLKYIMQKEFQGKKKCHTPEFKWNLNDESQTYLYKIKYRWLKEKRKYLKKNQ